ncbi:MAG: Clp protease ClpP [Selenomonadaceae bacterium]|nr:Clp protease ClpP [Selenomonadaceae bacterium]
MKFWNKASASADIFIYGDIVSDAWFDTDTTAKSFVDDLKSFGSKPVTVHINSAGGDCFTALAISNAIKNRGNVTVSIDGLCASAATLIACGADKVLMASNALYMIHAPAVGLNGFFDTSELTRIQTSMSAIETAMFDTYESRVNRADVPAESRLDIRTMIQSETWLNASQALSGGFVDEITGEVDMQVDDAKKLLVVNKLNVDMKKFDEDKLRRVLEAKAMAKAVPETQKPDTAPVENPTPEVENKTAPVLDAAAIRAQELGRIRALMNLRGTNAAVDALIEVAIDHGKTVDDMQPYFDAVKNIAPPAPKVENAVDKINAVIRDQMQSGAEGVTASQVAVDPVKAQQDLVVQYANGGK